MYFYTQSQQLFDHQIYIVTQHNVCLRQDLSKKKVLEIPPHSTQVMYTHIYVGCNNDTVTLACICLNIVFIHTTLNLNRQQLQYDPLF